MKFIIERFPVLPDEIVRVPNGEVLMAAFVGQSAYAWIRIEEDETEAMGLVVIPNGGPYDLQETEEFQSPVHVASFMKRSTIKTSTLNDTGVAFHLFCWKPRIYLNPDGN